MNLNEFEMTRSRIPNPDLEIVIAREPLPAGRQGSNLAFFNEIAAPACRNVTTACRHAPYPAFSGTRNDPLGLGFRFLIEDRKSNATGVSAILTCVCDIFVVLALTSPFGKGGLRGIFLGLKSPLAPLC
jgi:hypothetical protein